MKSIKKELSDHIEYRNENDQFHREDGPALIWFKYNNPYNIYAESWWINGKRHRIGAPAVVYANGDEHYFIEDISYPKHQYWKALVDKGLMTKEEVFLHLL